MKAERFVQKDPIFRLKQHVSELEQTALIEL
jgi:hypothetical protein